MAQFKAKVTGLRIEGLTVGKTRSRHEFFNIVPAMVIYTYRELFDERPSLWDTEKLNKLVQTDEDVNSMFD